MKYKGKQTLHSYEITDTEKLVLIGILSTLNKDGEIKLKDDQSKAYVKGLLNGFNQM
ncbi:hypothetical protein [Priestia flexa]|uniref:hypothetical protein n=1 Tax=Priestia flexa TaxID=86664 RepID=UPI000AC48600|nr:hypothetical protein [Priestia flexa]